MARRPPTTLLDWMNGMIFSGDEGFVSSIETNVGRAVAENNTGALEMHVLTLLSAAEGIDGRAKLLTAFELALDKLIALDPRRAALAVVNASDGIDPLLYREQFVSRALESLGTGENDREALYKGATIHLRMVEKRLHGKLDKQGAAIVEDTASILRKLYAHEQYKGEVTAVVAALKSLLAEVSIKSETERTHLMSILDSVVDPAPTRGPATDDNVKGRRGNPRGKRHET